MSNPKRVTDGDVRRMTELQRNLLIDHIDGPIDVALNNSALVQTRLALLKTDLLRGAPQGSIRPRRTALTERGRMVLAILLGHYADSLIRAGMLEREAIKRFRSASPDTGSSPHSDRPSAPLP